MLAPEPGHSVVTSVNPRSLKQRGTRGNIFGVRVCRVWPGPNTLPELSRTSPVSKRRHGCCTWLWVAGAAAAATAPPHETTGYGIYRY